MIRLLRHYYDTLTADLRLLGIPLDNCPLQDFLSEYKRRSLMGLFFGGLIMSMGLAKAVVSTMQQLDEEEQLKEPVNRTSKQGELYFNLSGLSSANIIIIAIFINLFSCEN
jgi:hypothetical protein